MPAERIAKRLARSGVCSRREAEKLIEQGRITVNGDIISSPALNVEDKDKILVDGEPLPKKEAPRLWLYHKTKGTICTDRDPQGRTTVFDDIAKKNPHLPRLMSIGRLDYNSEGLLLLTNSGALAHYLELPQTGWIRRYKVRVHGHPTERKLKNLENGIEIDGVTYGSIKATIETTETKSANRWITVSLKEGKNQEIRKVMKHLGYAVNRLMRISYGAFQLGKLEERMVEEVPEKTLKEQFGKKWETFF